MHIRKYLPKNIKMLDRYTLQRGSLMAEDNSTNIENYFKELNELREKYSIPKGIGFVPDKIVIELERKENDKFKLDYYEYFNYVPPHILNQVIPLTITLMQQMGVPSEATCQLENGIYIKLEGYSSVIFHPIIELFLQSEKNTQNIENSLVLLHDMIMMFLNTINFKYEYTTEIENEFLSNLLRMQQLMLNNPTISKEFEALHRKYSESLKSDFRAAVGARHCACKK